MLPVSAVSVVLLLFVFFTAFNLLEAMLPSLISRVAPADCRGTAMGFYSSSQFFGAFLGGTLGGLLQGRYGTHAVFLCARSRCPAVAVAGSCPCRDRKNSAAIYVRMDVTGPAEVEQLSRQLAALAGVAEAVVVAEEGVAYLKVDKQLL